MIIKVKHWSFVKLYEYGDVHVMVVIFCIFDFCFCFVVAMCDLVLDVEDIHGLN